MCVCVCVRERPAEGDGERARIMTKRLSRYPRTQYKIGTYKQYTVHKQYTVKYTVHKMPRWRDNINTLKQHMSALNKR